MARNPDRKWTVRLNGVFVSEHNSEAGAYSAASDEANRTGKTTSIVETGLDGAVVGSQQQVQPMFRETCLCRTSTSWYGTPRAAAEALATHQAHCRRIQQGR